MLKITHWLKESVSNPATGISNVMAICLFGAIFIQAKPAVVAMFLCVLMFMLSLSMRSVRHGLKQATLKDLRWIWIAMLVWPLVTGLLMLVQPYPIPLQSLGNPIRAVLALGVLAYMLIYPPRTIFLLIGILIACVASFVHGVHDVYVNHFARALGWFNNENHFGNYSALVGILAIVTGFLCSGWAAQMRIGSLVVGVLALWAAAASGTRTSLVIVACLVPLLFTKFQDKPARLLRNITLACIAGAIGLALMSPKVQHFIRINEAKSDFQSIRNTTGGSSIGDRLQMWKASINMFEASPLLGAGLANYEKELLKQIEQKKVLPLLASQNQAHSQPLHSLATGGIALLLAYLLFIGGPFVWFLAAYLRFKGQSEVRSLSYIGMSVVASHSIFSLTVAIFDVQVFSSLYVIIVCCLAAMVYASKERLLSAGSVALNG